MRNCAQTDGVQIGAAAAARGLQDDPRYAETLTQYFSMVTPENAMKFGPIHPAQNLYDFDNADYIADFAQANGMQVRGHTLVWHNQLPRWVEKGDWTKEELMEVLRDHIYTVVGRYRGRVAAWDVVNEALNEDGTLRDTIWLRVIGPEYIEMAFRWAHEADPDALLFYNDYNAEGINRKADGVYALVEDLVQRDVPIHGVGLQMHLDLTRHLDSESVAANIERLSTLGVQVHITEMDVRIPTPVTEEKLKAQAAVYGDMLRVCLSSENCTAFVLWGFTDNYSWVPSAFPGYGSALIFDEHYEPKPACEALEEVIVSH
jgi:endo-1,4-beta-xylanase